MGSTKALHYSSRSAHLGAGDEESGTSHEQPFQVMDTQIASLVVDLSYGVRELLLKCSQFEDWCPGRRKPL